MLLVHILYRLEIYLTVCTHDWSDEFNFIACNASGQKIATGGYQKNDRRLRLINIIKTRERPE